jgi:hypothetical protein
VLAYSCRCASTIESFRLSSIARATRGDLVTDLLLRSG